MALEDYIDYLERARSNGDLIGLHTDTDNIAKFTLGFIIDVSKENYQIHKLNLSGAPDGFEFGSLERIQKLTLTAPYFTLLEHRMRLNPAFTQVNMPPKCVDIRDILMHVHALQRVVNVCSSHESLACGTILALNNHTIEINAFRNDGSLDGRELIPLGAIEYLSFAGINELLLEERIRMQ